MLGSIVGDIVGSIYEFDNIKTKDFDLISLESRFTDDTVCTAAVADIFLNRKDPTRTMVEWCRKYPAQGYGNLFMRWFNMPFQEPYNSFGNGSAMRVGAVAWLASSLDEALSMSDQVTAITHNHPEGLKGARAVVHATYMARTGAKRDSIRDKIERVYGYDLSRSVDQIRDGYEFDETCQMTVPQALSCALESTSFEDAIRNAISIGGDSDTIGAIAGGLAEAIHGLDDALSAEARKRLPADILQIVNRFYTVVNSNLVGDTAPDPLAVKNPRLKLSVEGRKEIFVQPPARFDIQECQAFFTLFARFEYAMKATGIRQARNSGAVEANWNQLAEEVGFDLMAITEKHIQEAYIYLLQQPPKRQDLEGDQLVWSVVPASQGSAPKDLFVYICRVRNNLFHGGKFRGRYLSDSERSSQLIGASTVILKAILQLHPKLNEAFHG